MKTVQDLLGTKGRDVWTVGPDATVREALSLMAEKDVGALVVTRDHRIVGVISERDYARKVIIHGQSSLETLVGDVMAREPRCVKPDQTIADCMALMTDRHIRHLPVLDGDRLSGVLSIGDLVKSIIGTQKSKIEELEGLIYGG